MMNIALLVAYLAWLSLANGWTRSMHMAIPRPPTKSVSNKPFQYREVTVEVQGKP